MTLQYYKSTPAGDIFSKARKKGARDVKKRKKRAAISRPMYSVPTSVLGPKLQNASEYYNLYYDLYDTSYRDFLYKQHAKTPISGMEENRLNKEMFDNKKRMNEVIDKLSNKTLTAIDNFLYVHTEEGDPGVDPDPKLLHAAKEAQRMLLNAKTSEQKVIALDHIKDLEHHSGYLLKDYSYPEAKKYGSSKEQNDFPVSELDQLADLSPQ